MAVWHEWRVTRPFAFSGGPDNVDTGNEKTTWKESMAKNETSGGDIETHTDGGDAGVLSDDLLFEALGVVKDSPGEMGDVDDDEIADGENDSENDDEGTEEVSEDDEDAGESTDEAEGEDEESEPDVEDDEDAVEEEKKPQSVAKLQKRVSKLTARAKTAEERVVTLESSLDEAQTRLAEVETPVLAPTLANPLADLSTEIAVNDRVNQAKMIRKWCKMNPDGGSVETAKGSVELSREDVNERLTMAEEIIDDHAPAQLVRIREGSKFDGYTRKVYPGLFKSGSPEAKAAENFLQQVPELRKLPNWRLIIGDALMGGALRNSKQEGKADAEKKGAEVPLKKVMRAVKPSAAKPAASQGVQANAKIKRFMQSGRSEDLDAALMAGAL